MLGPVPPTIGGIATHVQNIIHGPLQDKYQFLHVETMSRMHGTDSYKVESLIKKIKQIIKDWFVLIRLIIKKKPHTCHIHTSLNTGAFWRDSLYLITCRFFGKRILLQIHGGKLDEFLAIYPQIIQRIILHILNLAHQIIVLSNFQADAFKGTYIQDRLLIIPNMIEYTDFQFTPQYKGNNNVSILMIASHFTREKGVFEILEAINRLSSNDIQCNLIIIGSGKEEEAMRSFIKTHTLDDKVQITGFLGKSEIIHHLQHSSIFVLPSYSEGFPMVVLEAMASGLPIVATRVGAIPEMIKNDINGYVVDIKSIDQLTDKIKHLIEYPEKRSAMGQANIVKVRQLYSLEAVSEKFDKLYSSLTGDRA